LLKRLDQVLRQVTYYELCHRSLLRRRIRQLYRFDGPDASIDSSALNGLRPTLRSSCVPWVTRLAGENLAAMREVSPRNGRRPFWRVNQGNACSNVLKPSQFVRLR
jgi:hypothetical protein